MEQPPPAAGGRSDRISCLHDSILETILSFLSAKDAAKTSSLSRRWRYVWTTSPLTIDSREIYDSGVDADDGRGRLESAMDAILLYHRGPIHSCSLFNLVADDPALYYWFLVLARRGGGCCIRSLTLHFDEIDAIPDCLSWSSLQKLDLRKCVIPERMLLSPSTFPNLKDLRLDRVYRTEEAFISNLLSDCRRVERLALYECEGIRQIRIRSPSLRCLILSFRDEYALAHENEFEEIIVDGAPELETLKLSDNLSEFATIKILHAPKLNLLGVLSAKPKRLQFGQVNLVLSAAASMASLKTLAIKVNLDDIKQINMVFNLLRCFPRLETLDFMLEASSLKLLPGMCQRFLEEQQGPQLHSMENHVRGIRLKGFEPFDSRPSHTEFATFLVEKALALSEITVLCADGELSILLSLRNKSPSGAKVVCKNYCEGYEFPTWERLSASGFEDPDFP